MPWVAGSSPVSRSFINSRNDRRNRGQAPFYEDAFTHFPYLRAICIFGSIWKEIPD